MHQLLSAKRVAYRNQIRRKEINELFCEKRRLLTHSLPMDIEQQTFKNIFQLLKEQKNRSNTLAQLSSLTFQRCLSQQASNQNEAESMYEELIIFLIDIIHKNVKRQREETVERITCLNIIGNLLTQPLCPNYKVSNQICQMLMNFYEGVQQWGKQDEQICQVGWVVSNLINRKNFASQIDDTHINFLLEWIEELLHLKNKLLIQNICFGLKRFIPSLQERYNLSSCQLPQLHKSHILIILDLTIFDKQINQAEVFTSSNKIAEFLQEIVPIVMVSCSLDWTERIISTIFDNLGTFKKKLFKSLCQVINRMMNFRDVRFNSQQEILKAESIRRKAQNLIMETYFTKFIIFLQTRQTLMKEQLLDVLTKILQCQKVDSCYYLSRLLQSGLQELMIKIFTVDNPDLSFALMELVRVGSELDLSHGFARFISHKMICNIIEHYKSQ